jgi:hypothetical protein
VCDQETSKNEEAKERYWTVERQPKFVVTPGKQNIYLLCYGLISVGRILLNYILILCETNFVPELQSHFVCSAVELALKRNILLYNTVLSFGIFLVHADWTDMKNVVS